jgi:hypothetical protein
MNYINYLEELHSDLKSDAFGHAGSIPAVLTSFFTKSAEVVAAERTTGAEGADGSPVT